MVGDGLMAIFGAPLPLEDSASAAVNAAREMLEMLELLNVEHRAAGKPELRIGIGIATGDVVAGYTGTQDRATYTCVGNTVNLAARLEQHTKEAGEAILVDGETKRAMATSIAARPLGSVPIRGRAGPIEVFAVAAR
jgi:class 3 adenylate cyclase